MPFVYPTLDQAQQALISVVTTLTNGEVTTKQEAKDLYVLLGYGLSMYLGDPNSVVTNKNVFVSHTDMLAMLDQWNKTGNSRVTMAHPFRPELAIEIPWQQLIMAILPILLQAIQQGLMK